MANPEHVAKLRDGVHESWGVYESDHLAWNSWMEVEGPMARFGNFDFAYSVMMDPLLEGAVRGNREVDLSGADLSGIRLRELNLRGGNLRGANLSGAGLWKTDLTGANLTGANLKGAHFWETNLTGAILRDADLSGAKLSYASFVNTDLSDVRGLDTCVHEGPSTLDHRTLAQSGVLPMVFLRRCGLAETLIDSLPSIFGYGREFASCFISYSTKDQEFADRLYEDLHQKGVKCWFAPHDIQGGKKIHEQIDEAIREYDRLLLILSPDSMGSEWVKTEIAKARRREATEKRRMLFPVRLVGFEALRDWECFDADAGKDSAREIREYFVPDFSEWRDRERYRRELERLVRDLIAG